MKDPIARQNAEFDALDTLIKAYQYHNQVAVVDDEYPRARHTYEAALIFFFEVCKENGRKFP